MELPPQLTFESMAREFVNIVSEYRPTSASVMRVLSKLGVENNIPAAIIVLTQFRDAVRGVADRVFKSIEHRNAVYDAIIDALDDLEAKQEEIEEAKEKLEEL